MRFAILLALFLIADAADAQLKERTAAPPPAEQTAGLVDEDEDLLPATTYAFNPIQAKKDLKIGDFYAKKGNDRAAAARYLEATRWNPQYGEAYWKLAEARDELGQNPQALDAYRAYLALEPNGKQAKQAQMRIAQLVEALKSPPLAAEEAKDAETPQAARIEAADRQE
jgi:tetratricopeptide (TPR) repeat protein